MFAVALESTPGKNQVLIGNALFISTGNLLQERYQNRSEPPSFLNPNRVDHATSLDGTYAAN